MKTLNIAEARGRFSELVEDVHGGGGPVIVSRYGRPMVMIVPAQVDPPEKPEPFPLRGVPLEIPPDFDESMDSLWDALAEPASSTRIRPTGSSSPSRVGKARSSSLPTVRSLTIPMSLPAGTDAPSP